MARNTNTTNLETPRTEPETTDSIETSSELSENPPGTSAVDETQSTATSSDAATPSGGDTGEQTHADGLSLDHIFGILKNQRRRRVLRFLHETDDQTSLSEVAEQIAAQENDKNVKQISSAERKRVYVGLYQCHLPKMDSMDIVSFNKPRGTIELDEHAPEVYQYIHTDDDTADPAWHERSVVLSLYGAAVLVGSLAIQPMTTVPVMNIAVATIVVSFFLYALAGLRWRRSGQNSDEQPVENVSGPNKKNDQ